MTLSVAFADVLLGFFIGYSTGIVAGSVTISLIALWAWRRN